MTFRELEELLGAGGRRHLLHAYKSPENIRGYRKKDLNVTQEKMRLVIESINQHIKELRSTTKELKKHMVG